jgi:TonB family protein
MDVSDVLRDRMQEPEGLRRMAVISLAVHLAVGAAVFLGPGRWLPPRSDSQQATMTITLGGGAGPTNGGMTSIGGRPVQTTEPAPVREAVRPPAAVQPEMTLPKERTTAPVQRARPAPKITEAPSDARGRTPTRGDEVRPGSAVAETGARGQGFGLSTGGGAGSGSTLDVANFCCPDYLVQMTERIRSNWNQQSEVPGQVVVKFTIARDGTLNDVDVERSSGYGALDLGARRAVLLTRQLPPLPAPFPNPTLTVHLNFQYQR